MKKTPIQDSGHRIKSLLDGKGRRSVLKGEVLIGSAFMARTGFEDTIDNHFRIAEKLGQDTVCLPVSEKQRQNDMQLLDKVLGGIFIAGIEATLLERDVPSPVEMEALKVFVGRFAGQRCLILCSSCGLYRPNFWGRLQRIYGAPGTYTAGHSGLTASWRRRPLKDRPLFTTLRSEIRNSLGV